MSFAGVPGHEEMEARLIKGFDELNQDLIKQYDKVGIVFDILNNCTNE